jgi:hypothetical protein
MVLVLMLTVCDGNDREKTYWKRKEKYIGLTWRLLVQFIFQSVRPNNKQICLMKCKITSFKLKAQKPTAKNWCHRSSSFAKAPVDTAVNENRQPSTVPDVRD